MQWSIFGSDNMKYKRYGKFRFMDYITSWFAISILLIYSIISCILNLSILFVVFPMIYATIWLLMILVPHQEKFTVSGNLITVYFLKRIEKIIIPNEITLIISYMDISPPLSVHSTINRQTHILKKQYSISIIAGEQLNTILEKLHKNCLSQYTTSYIKRVFNSNYIYSFAFDTHIFDILLKEKVCTLIVPKSLLNKISLEQGNVDIYIDDNY